MESILESVPIMESILESVRMGKKESITEMYELIVRYPHLLEHIDNIPLIETPLHVAAEYGCTHFALELMSLKPSFARKMNLKGLTPINLAVQKGKTEFVKQLVDFDNKLVQVKGKKGRTPLHHAAKTGDIDLLAKFLMVCPQSISDLTVYGQNAVHVAAKYGKKKALDMLLGWLQRTGNNDVLHLKDHEGNTVLHIVASNHDKYAAEDFDNVLAMLRKKIANGEQNSRGETALQIITHSKKLTDKQKAGEKNYKKILRSQSKYSTGTTFAEFLCSPETILEKVLRFDINMRKNLPIATVNALLVVATLIVTATYQAVLDPPKLKNPFTRSESDSLEPFLTLNTVTFSLAVGIIICLLEVSKSSAPVHFSLVYLYFNYMALVWSRHDSLRPVLVSAATFSINYLIILGRMSMALFEFKGVARNYFTFGHFNGTVSRLEMQHKTIDSVFSSRQGSRKVLIKS